MGKALTVQGLRKSYGGVTAVDDVNLEVERGEIFGLLGANGAGKTTSIECILGVKKPDAGRVEILGMSPYIRRKKLFERVSVQFQESHYQDKITVRELCAVTASLYKKAANYRDLLRQFGIEDKLKNPVSELSGGQKQRLFIVLALISQPEMVFLDELTTGLDARARREVWQCLREAKANGLTIILTSHFMDEVETLCDRILILKKGRIIYAGDVAGAIKNSPYEKFEDAYLWYTDETREDIAI